MENCLSHPDNSADSPTAHAPRGNDVSRRAIIVAWAVWSFWLRHRRHAITIVLLSLIIELMSLLLLRQKLEATSISLEKLIAIAGQEARPDLSIVTPLATDFVAHISFILGTQILLWFILDVAFRIWLRRKIHRPISEMNNWRKNFDVIVIVMLFTLTLSVLTTAMLSPWQRVNHQEIRGSVISIVVPSPLMLATTLLVAGVTLVTVMNLARYPQIHHTALPPLRQVPQTRERPLGIALIMITLGGYATTFLVATLVAIPISDDLRIMALVRDHDLLSYLKQHLTFETGRYSQAILNWLFATIWGDHVSTGTALSVFIALLIAIYASVRTFLPEHPMTSSWPLAMGLTLIPVFTVPSLVDSWLWFTAADVYLPGIAGILGCITLTRRLWSGPQSPRRWLALGTLLSIMVFISQGFVESISAILWAMASAFLLWVLLRHRTKYALSLASSAWLSASAGIALIALAPAQQLRSDHTASGHPLIGILGGVYSGLPVWNQIHWHGWLLIVGVAVLLSRHLLAASGTTIARSAIIGMALIVTIPPLCGSIAFLGLSWAPWRTLTISAIGFSWGVLLFLAAGIATGYRLTPRLTAQHHRSAIGACLLMGAGALCVIPATMPTITALSLRAQLVTARDASMTAQRESGATTIQITPAPLLVYPTDTRDFEYLEEQHKDWFSAGYRQWYRIPSPVTLTYVTQQPLGYCVNTELLLPHVDTCSQLGQQTAPLP